MPSLLISTVQSTEPSETEKGEREGGRRRGEEKGAGRWKLSSGGGGGVLSRRGQEEVGLGLVRAIDLVHFRWLTALGGMEDSTTTTSAVGLASLPDGPLVEILSRVPAKSICRFKCVSKAWRDLIADPHHRKKLLPQAMQGLFIMTPNCSEDDEPLVCDHFIFRIIDLTGGLTPLGIDPSFSFLKKLPGIQILVLMDSCNGLILFENCPEPFSDAMSYIVCNPTTKQWEALPTCGSPEMITYTYMAFNPFVSSHFNLVQLQTPDLEKELISLHAYSSETGTWSRNRILEQEEQGQLKGWRQVKLAARGDPWCAFVNGFLYLTVRDSDDQNKIAVVDVQGNTRRMISVPEAARGIYFGQSQGRLHYMTRKPLDADEELSIWVLQDSDTQEWVLKDTVSSLKLFGEKSCTGGMLETIEVIDIHQDCNTVFCINSLSHKLVAYNMDRREVSVIGTFKDSGRWMGIGRYVPYFSELPALKTKH